MNLKQKWLILFRNKYGMFLGWWMPHDHNLSVSRIGWQIVRLSVDKRVLTTPMIVRRLCRLKRPFWFPHEILATNHSSVSNRPPFSSVTSTLTANLGKLWPAYVHLYRPSSTIVHRIWRAPPINTGWAAADIINPKSAKALHSNWNQL